MDLKIKGKTAMVSGGTKGIGRAIVEAFAAEGANVAFCARNPEEVAQTEKDIAAMGVKAKGTVLDVSDAAGMKAWVSDTAKEFGGIDMAVANVSALQFPMRMKTGRQASELTNGNGEHDEGGDSTS